MTYSISEADVERQQVLAQALNPLTLPILERLPQAEIRNVLDLGCGQGNTTRMLAMQFPDRPELKPRVHAAALVALNFVLPLVLQQLAEGAQEIVVETPQEDGSPAPGADAKLRVASNAIECLQAYQARFGSIPRELILAFQTWAEAIQVR